MAVSLPSLPPSLRGCFFVSLLLCLLQGHLSLHLGPLQSRMSSSQSLTLLIYKDFYMAGKGPPGHAPRAPTRQRTLSELMPEMGQEERGAQGLFLKPSGLLHSLSPMTLGTHLFHCMLTNHFMFLRT